MERSLSKTLVTITIIILSIGIITILVWLAIKISKSNESITVVFVELFQVVNGNIVRYKNAHICTSHENICLYYSIIWEKSKVKLLIFGNFF